MRDLTAFEQEAFDTSRDLFESALQSDMYQTWVSDAEKNFGYYEGPGQWDADDLEKAREAGLKPTTINLIKARINSLAKNEISNRTKFSFKSRSGKPVEVSTAQGLSNIALWVQDRNRTSQLLTEAKHNARICGLGFHSFEVSGGRVYEFVDSPFDVVWDVRDRTPGLNNQGFAGRVKWMTRKRAKLKWPKLSDEIDSIARAVGGTYMYEGSSFSSTGRLLSVGNYFDKENDEIAVIEFQYLEPETVYTYVTKNDLIARTFDLDEAKKNRKKGSAIEEAEGNKLYFCYFSGDVFLEAFEYQYQIDPVRGALMTTPVVYARSMVDGVPYGIVGDMRDPQRLVNVKNAKVSWLMADKTAILDEGAVSDIRALAKKINRPNAIIEKKPGKEFRIENHSAEIAQQLPSISIHKREIQEVSGIFDEQMGMETNAKSGVAIERRQMAGLSTQLLGNDRFNEAKHEIAVKMLGLIQTVYPESVAANVIDDDDLARQLNLRVEGEEKAVVDIRAGEYDVSIDEVPDVSSHNDEAKLILRETIQSNPAVVQNPIILRLLVHLFGLAETQAVKEIFAMLDQQQAAAAAAQGIGDANAAPMGGGPSPAGQPVRMM